MWRLIRELFGAAKRRRLVICFVCSHAGCKYNERADELAKEAAKLPQHNVPVTLQTAAAAVRRGGDGTAELFERVVVIQHHLPRSELVHAACLRFRLS